VLRAVLAVVVLVTVAVTPVFDEIPLSVGSETASSHRVIETFTHE